MFFTRHLFATSFVLGLAMPAAAQLPADLPKLVTHTDLRQPNGRPINAHLVNCTIISTYMLNQHLTRRNSLPNEQQQAEEQERAALAARHTSAATSIEASPVDAARMAYLQGYASVETQRALRQLYRQEQQLGDQEDPGFAQQSAADQRSAFEAINQDNRQSGTPSAPW